MSRNEKTIAKFLEKPVRTDLTLGDVTAVAKIVNAQIIIGGRHSIHFVHKESGTVIPIPLHGKSIGAAYIKQIAKLIESLQGGN